MGCNGNIDNFVRESLGLIYINTCMVFNLACDFLFVRPMSYINLWITGCNGNIDPFVRES
jgi:hypothetical protein